MIDETAQKDNSKSTSPPIQLKSVELGDILQIHAPRNREIHDQIYYVFYVDEKRLKLLNTSNRQLLSLAIESYVADESITGISLLSRSKEKGFARQNRLVPLTWVDVHFGGEMPAVISGEITNLEEDMIEITTYPDIRVIYIDFGYQGIPEDLPIDKIVIRDKPASVKRRIRSEDTNEISREEAEEMATIEYDNQGEFIIHIPENVMPNPSVESALDDMIDHEVDVAVEDDDLGEILVNVEVAESERRYSVEAQVADLMGELMSKGKEVSLDDAHRLVTRFKQLRHHFSVFDANENVVQPKITNVLYKPLVERIAHLDTPIPWIIPVIHQKRVMYRDEVTSETINEGFAGPNIELVSIIDDLAALNETEPEYGANIRKMAQLMKSVVEDRMFTDSYLDAHVQSPVECIVDTEGGFKSKVLELDLSKKQIYTESKAFVNRRLLPEDTMLTKHIKSRNSSIYIREPISNTGDIAHVKSLVFLPMSALLHSLCQLPSSDIYVKSKLAAVPLYKHRMLRELTEIPSREISDFSKEIRYKTSESESGEPFLHTFMHYYTEAEKDDDTLYSMLNSVIPRTRTLIRLMQPTLKPYYSFSQIITALEPFFVEQENITFQQYLEIRHYVKEKIKTYVSDFEKHKKEFSVLKTALSSRTAVNRVEDVFHSDFAQFFKNAYKLAPKGVEKSASELLNWVLSADAAELYLNMLRLEGLSYLTLPENLLESAAPDTSDPEKIKERDCASRFIAKKYLSLVELQKDSGQDVVFCDKVYDDTPYPLLSKYKDEKKRFNTEEFREFFIEKLIGVHDCPPHLAEELADSILLGKRRVKEGEYAVLELRPKLGQGLRLDDLSASEKREAEQEADNRKKTEYYRRVKDEWVRDTEVNADSFLDTNTLFCNLSSQCNKIPDSSQCVPSTTAAMQMRLSTRAKMVQEFDARVSKSIDELRTELETKVNEDRVTLRRSLVIKDDVLYKSNDYAYQLGKFVSSTESVVESPNAPLLELILSLPDFIDKQTRIVHFAEQFCRPPMETELQEDPHWMYCVQINVKLLPISIHLLAKAFMSNDYTNMLNELCRTHGTLSDDGDSIVDRFTGYVLRKIDYSAEEGFEESGFKITSNAIVEKDLATIVQETLAKKHPVFEDPIAQMIYTVFQAVADNAGITNKSDIEEFVLRVSNEMMYDTRIVSSEADYAQNAKKSDKEKKMPYTTYQNQTLITFVACTTLIALQTAIPSFRPKKTFPGCFQSFEGFPMDGNIENAGGIQYMACILHGIKKSSSQPWKSIEPLSASTLVKRMKPIIRDYVYVRPDVKKLYEAKRAYLLLHPDNLDIPTTISVNRWTHFLPPLGPPNLAKPPIAMDAEYEKEMFHSMTKGTKDQLKYVQAIKAKLLVHAYGIGELVEHIVSKKRAVLTTSAGQPFLENACCNDGLMVPLRYFANENENVALYAKRAIKMEEVLARVAYLSKAPIFFDPDSSRLTYTRLPDNIVETVIYAAYMYYGHFDDDVPIPHQFHTVIKDKPAYDRYGSLTEKMAYLKKHGKNYTLDDYYALMRIVNSHNVIHVIPEKTVSCINGFKDMLEYFDLKDSTIVEKRLRDLIWATLDEYNPKVMVYEERESVRALNQYLLRVNKKMGEIVYDFIWKTSSLPNAMANRIKDVIEKVDQWKVDSNVAFKQISNSVYLMSKVFPSQIMNNHVSTRVPKHWNLSELHNAKIRRDFIDKYYSELLPFFSEDDSMNTFKSYVSRVRNRINDLSLFLEQIPRFTPIQKGEFTYYSLYPENTVMLLYKYCWYSVLHEYVVVSTDAEFKRMREEEWKMKTRQNMKDRLDEIFGQDEDGEDEEDVRQIRIIESEDMELRKQASDLLVAMLKMESGVKSAVDKSYATVMESTEKLKYKDKRRITDYLAGLNKDDRKLEQLLRSHKLGRWNVGLQKGLYQYDKSTYEKEEMEDLVYTVPETTEGSGIEVEDLDRIDETENQVYEAEGYDIDRLDEEYENGHYYEEDYADDRETDF